MKRKRVKARSFVVMFLYSFLPALGFNQVFFTPRDDIKSHLIALIKEERLSIECAMYMITDKTIAQALVDAYVRGVKIRMVLDQLSMGEKYGKGLLLRSSGLTIFVHKTMSLNPFCMPIMHHKFFVFGYNARLHCSLAWTGSFNCTASASRLHDENVLLTDDQSVVEQYRQCFQALVDRLSGNRTVMYWNQDYA